MARAPSVAVWYFKLVIRPQLEGEVRPEQRRRQRHCACTKGLHFRALWSRLSFPAPLHTHATPEAAARCCCRAFFARIEGFESSVFVWYLREHPGALRGRPRHMEPAASAKGPSVTHWQWHSRRRSESSFSGALRTCQVCTQALALPACQGHWQIRSRRALSARRRARGWPGNGAFRMPLELSQVQV